MIRRLASIAVLLAVLALGAFAGRPERAFAAIEVKSSTTTNSFPNGIQFTVFLSSDATITDVRLRYRILPDGVNANVRPTCTTGAVINCQVQVGNTASVYMVPGADVVYTWDITDSNGGHLTTEEQTVVYEDKRYEWDHLTEGNLTVYYYFGDEASQRTVLQTAEETIQKQSALLRTTVDFPVKIWVYKTAQEMQPAVASRRGQGDNSSVQTLGEVGASDTALVSRDTDFLNIVRHELAHVVTGAATRNHLVDIPVWINEGLSTYAQNSMLPNEDTALRLAVQRNRALPITSLDASARGTADAVSLFYAESGSIIHFMVDTYGPDQFADFIAALANDTTDGALNTTFGFDQLGLENVWRKSVGLPQVSAADAAGVPTPQPTLVPLGSSQSNPTPANSGSQSQNNNPTPNAGQSAFPASTDSGGGDSLVTVAVILSAVLVLLLAVAAGVHLQSKRRPGG